MAEPLVRGTIVVDDIEREPLELLQALVETLATRCYEHKDPALWDIHNQLWSLLRALRGITDEEEMEMMP